MTDNELLQLVKAECEKYPQNIKYTVNKTSVHGLVAHFYSIDTPKINAVIYSLHGKNMHKYRSCIKNKSGNDVEVVGDAAHDLYSKFGRVYKAYLNVQGALPKTRTVFERTVRTKRYFNGLER